LVHGIFFQSNHCSSKRYFYYGVDNRCVGKYRQVEALLDTTTRHVFRVGSAISGPNGDAVVVTMAQELHGGSAVTKRSFNIRRPCLVVVEPSDTQHYQIVNPGSVSPTDAVVPLNAETVARLVNEWIADAKSHGELRNRPLPKSVRTAPPRARQPSRKPKRRRPPSPDDDALSSSEDSDSEPTPSLRQAVRRRSKKPRNEPPANTAPRSRTTSERGGPPPVAPPTAASCTTRAGLEPNELPRVPLGQLPWINATAAMAGQFPPTAASWPLPLQPSQALLPAAASPAQDARLWTAPAQVLASAAATPALCAHIPACPVQQRACVCGQLAAAPPTAPVPTPAASRAAAGSETSRAVLKAHVIFGFIFD